MLDAWIHDNALGVLVAIEVLWVGGFVGIFVLYFLVRRHFKRKARQSKEHHPHP